MELISGYLCIYSDGTGTNHKSSQFSVSQNIIHMHTRYFWLPFSVRLCFENEISCNRKLNYTYSIVSNCDIRDE